ncbi:DNA-formamidopyrimidine glycosylase [Priestia taiwanensis]|uniref:Formamidopyrimidine-DNA glycosylase n=1 Tax=Priestia taiwanensis TaxID=1347902 RepID=A0A917ERP1_9BACI|nr:DNA-formamidopyrimidine glycosylase [Priestia taiwanensis]MBM7363477.1 formamidopyrimidine-DNA glycosylase [Priestia taiwanensis]GGE76839.1 formamidopyrimidine-DNA glycosylase [Priestia taiwanensis]
MPELPEVETVRRTLLQLVQGKTIKEIDVHWPKIIKEPDDVEVFKSLLIGETIEDVRRRGKFLLIDLTNCTLVSHLRMEGKYTVANVSEPSDKHTHVLFTFTDDTQLRYRDVRKFGTMHVYPKGTENLYDPLKSLGPEPFDKAFTADYLYEKLHRTSRKVKVALLDQYIVVGLGNIYVDEVLHRSLIHPERVASSLTKEEVRRVWEETVATLQEAIDKGGSTIRTYVNSQGKIGTFQETLLVYGRKGESCVTCGVPIEKTVVGGRGTHYCPTCQK